MSCEQLERNLDAYVDRELDLEAAAAIRDHVDGCVSCRRRVAERQALSRLVRSMPYSAGAGPSPCSSCRANSRPSIDRQRADVGGSGGGGPGGRWRALTLIVRRRPRDSAIVEEVVNGQSGR